MCRGRGLRDVVIQPTKQGLLFVLDRDTGQPVWPVQERTPLGGRFFAGAIAALVAPALLATALWR